ncbi:restriction endonuclease subunit S [Nitrosomonas ureae]|uniref:Type I restriction enzyme, S subunit n=1 Tax=Nitrosomonas ureae TaxID=44577 RepID=A0A1H5V7U4_9PROT|nr:restriction endonuclease subunit S [Nitrosomonas ureae]SEF82848.1 type I restriction enzyme, S subunit [Nitrosomonas ureae]
MSFPRYESYKDSGVEWLGEVPEHWEIASLSRLFSIKAGGDVKTEFFSEFQTENHPYPIYTNANNENAVYGYTSKCNYSPNTITVSGRGEVGFAVYRDHPYDAIIRLLVLSPFGTGNCKFFSYFINVVINFSVQSSAIGQLSTQQISPYKVAFPSFEEQQSITNFLDCETVKIDALIAEQQRLIELLKEKRQSVISHAVTKGLNPNAPMKDSGIECLGKVPEHWEVCAIKRMTLLITDGAHISPETGGGVYDFISTKDISDKGIDFEGCLKTTSSSYEYLVRTGCQPICGDILFSKDGTIGRTVVIKEQRDFVVASSLIIIRPDSDILDSSYFNYLCQSSIVVQQVEGFVKGAGLPRLSIQNLLKVFGVFPSFVEQHSIVTFLDNETAKLDTLTTEAKTAITLLQERRTALISATVTGKIDVRGAGLS